MNFIQAVKCLKDNKCDFIWRSCWKDKKESNRIKYNYFDDCLEFAVNNKIYYAKSIDDICADDWQAVHKKAPISRKITRYVAYLLNESCEYVYTSIEQLKKYNPKFTGNIIALEGYVTEPVYEEESNFNVAYFGKEMECDVVFDLASILDRVRNCYIKHESIDKELIKNINSVLQRVEDANY